MFVAVFGEGTLWDRFAATLSQPPEVELLDAAPNCDHLKI